MKRSHIIAVVLVLLSVLGCSLLLVPNRRELALMHLRDKDFDTARELYSGESARSDLPVSVVVPLTELHLQNADVPAAVALMERFVREHPRNMSALRRLGQLYRYAQRTADVLANLEEICSLDPTEDELRELSNIYNFTSQYSKQISVLEQLLRLQPDNPRNFLDLAYLQASQGRVADAAGTMRTFEARHPPAIDDDSVEFHLSLLLDSSEAEEAFSRACRWLSSHPDADVAARFTSLLRFKRQPALALRLLEPLEGMFAEHPALLAQLVQLQIEVGLGTEAFRRLRALNDAGRLPDDVAPDFINFSLESGDVDTAIAVARRGPLDRLPDWLLLSLVDHAIAGKKTIFAGEIMTSAGHGFFASHPVAAARVAFFLQDLSSTKRWIDAAEKEPALDSGQAIALAELLVSLDRRADAIRFLAGVAESADTPDSAIQELAVLCVESGGAPAGLPLFNRLRKLRHSARIDAAWSLVSAGAGVYAPVVSWLEGRPSPEPGERLLLDLYYMGDDGRSPELSVAAAARLFQRTSGRRERFLLGRALIASRRFAEAVPCLRPLVPGSDEEESAYLEVLSAIVSEGGEFREELRGFLARKLADPRQPDARREDLVRELLELRDYDTALPVAAELAARRGGDWFSLYVESASLAGRKEQLQAFLCAELARGDLSDAAREERLHVLLDSGGTAEAVPYLREYSNRRRGEWVAAYEEALEKLKRFDELHASWRNRLARPDTPAEERREIAYRALAEGRKEIGEAAFRALAADAAPDSPDVSELLFIWGPRPASAALDWLAARAARSSGDELARWMQQLVNLGGARRAVDVGRSRLPPPGEGGPVLRAFLVALAASGEKAELARVLEREIAAGSAASELKHIGILAYDAGLTRTATAALQKVLALVPEDRDALRRLGVLAFSTSNFTSARALLSRYLAAGEGDYESNWCYGELLLRDGKAHLARNHFERALDRLGRPDTAAGAGVDSVKARLLFRLGRVEEALALSKRLITGNPDDRALRADLVAAMLDAGLPDQAGVYLEGVESAGSEHPASRAGEDGSAAEVRLGILGAHLKGERGRMREAASQLRRLAAVHPADPDVLTGLASLESQSGRWRRALALYDRALALSPESEDVSEARTRLFEDRGSRAAIEYSNKSVSEGWQEHAARASGQVLFGASFRTGAVVESSHVRTEQNTRETGGIFEGIRRRAELFVQRSLENGTELSGSFFLSQRKRGAGASFSRPDERGVTRMLVDYRRPYWEFVEGIVGGGYRDRLEANREHRFARRWSGWGSVSLNRYGLARTGTAAGSAGFSGGLNFLVASRPALVLQYGFDGEYRTSLRSLTDAAGAAYAPIPLVSREVHALDVAVGCELRPHLRVDAFAGLAVDRLGGTGPYLGASLTGRVSRHVELRVDYERRLNSVDTGRVVNRLTGRAGWKLGR